MALKRTPEPDDAELLRYSGLMGHRYTTTVAGPEGKRLNSIESDDIPTLPKLRERGLTDARTFEKVIGVAGKLPVRKWRRVR